MSGMMKIMSVLDWKCMDVHCKVHSCYDSLLHYH